PRHPRPTTPCSPGLSHVYAETTPEQRGPSQLGDSVNSWKPEPANTDARSRHCGARFPWGPPAGVGVDGAAVLFIETKSGRVPRKLNGSRLRRWRDTPGAQREPRSGAAPRGSGFAQTAPRRHRRASGSVKPQTVQNSTAIGSEEVRPADVG